MRRQKHTALTTRLRAGRRPSAHGALSGGECLVQHAGHRGHRCPRNGDARSHRSGSAQILQRSSPVVSPLGGRHGTLSAPVALLHQKWNAGHQGNVCQPNAQGQVTLRTTHHRLRRAAGTGAAKAQALKHLLSAGGGTFPQCGGVGLGLSGRGCGLRTHPGRKAHGRYLPAVCSVKRTYTARTYTARRHPRLLGVCRPLLKLVADAVSHRQNPSGSPAPALASTAA